MPRRARDGRARGPIVRDRDHLASQELAAAVAESTLPARQGAVPGRAGSVDVIEDRVSPGQRDPHPTAPTVLGDLRPADGWSCEGSLGSRLEEALELHGWRAVVDRDDAPAARRRRARRAGQSPARASPRARWGSPCGSRSPTILTSRPNCSVQQYCDGRYGAAWSPCSSARTAARAWSTALVQCGERVSSPSPSEITVTSPCGDDVGSYPAAGVDDDAAVHLHTGAGEPLDVGHVADRRDDQIGLQAGAVDQFHPDGGGGAEQPDAAVGDDDADPRPRGHGPDVPAHDGAEQPVQRRSQVDDGDVQAQRAGGGGDLHAEEPAAHDQHGGRRGQAPTQAVASPWGRSTRSSWPGRPSRLARPPVAMTRPS